MSKKLTATDRDLLTVQDHLRTTWRGKKRPIADKLAMELGKCRLLIAGNSKYTGPAKPTNGKYDFIVSFRSVMPYGDARVELFASMKVRNVPGNGSTPDDAVMDARDNARKYLSDGIRKLKHPLRAAFLKKVSLKVLKGPVSTAEYDGLKDAFRADVGKRMRAADKKARSAMLAQFSLI